MYFSQILSVSDMLCDVLPADDNAIHTWDHGNIGY